ncbi:hypothetical protein [Haliscomenobacter sp.]|uniref:hypothetical protein n=1 Tax=Haliscomenobacter sp. TaxID=2717303 RepID=UPI003365039B
MITEVYSTGEVELKNLGTSNVNISTYWLCNFPAYDLISDLTFTCGSAVIEPGKVAVVKGQSVTVPLADITSKYQPGTECKIWFDFG